MIYTTQDLIPEVSLEKLLEEETESYIQLIPIIESTHYERMNIVNIEDLISFSENSALDFDGVLNLVAHAHNIDLSNLAFSVKPSSVYLDEEVKYICSIIKENNIPLFLKNDDNSDENLLINSLCLECEQTYSDEPLSLLEAYLDEEGAAATLISSVKKGVKSGLAKTIDRNTFGRILDTKDPTTGKVTKNGRLMKHFGHGDNVLKDIAGDVTDNVRSGASMAAVEKLDKAVGMNSTNKYSLRSLLNAVQKKLGYYQDQQQAPAASIGGDPTKKQSIFARIIAKLKALKDKILALLRGRGQ